MKGYRLHLMHMRWLVYRDAIIKAVKLAHREMAAYKAALADNVACRNNKENTK